MRFVQLEPHLTRYSGDPGVVMACVAASMHPKLLYKDAGNVWKTLTNNAPVAIHPSSSNFIHGRKADFGNASFLTYFNIQQSKKLYVWENGVVDEKAVLLLCGDVDVKVSSQPFPHLKSAAQGTDDARSLSPSTMLTPLPWTARSGGT